MEKNLSEIQYDVTKKTKLRKFYETNKKLIFFLAIVLIISIFSIGFFIDSKKNKKIQLSEDYIQSKIYLENEDKNAK